MSGKALTLAARGAVIPVARQAALTVSAPGSRAALAAVGERVASGLVCSGSALTAPAAQTAGEA